MPIKAKPKVAHLTSVHPASDTRIAYKECATLAEAGYDVVLIAAAGEVAGLPAGVRLHRVPVPSNRFERMTRTIWHVYRAALLERADVYHFHDPELMGIGLALRMSGARVVFDVHEDIPNDIVDKVWIPVPVRPLVAGASALALRFLHRWYSAIVTATPTIAKRFPHRRTVVVHNYPRLDELAGGGDIPEFSSRPRSVIYLGQITELRCIDEMVDAVGSDRMPDDVRLHLAGDFETPELERRIRSLPGFRRVRYTGYCPRSQVASALSSARAGLLLFQTAANHEDALPNKLFEYLGAGLPVIISDALRCSAMVREQECGIVVNAADTHEIARAIMTLIDNPALAQKMGERGRALVRERFQWTSEASKLKQLYAEIA
jgi:glycosyltransferase involved in cell wall biosynthesis